MLVGVGCEEGPDDGGGIIVGVWATTGVGVVVVGDVGPMWIGEYVGGWDDGEVARGARGLVSVV